MMTAVIRPVLIALILLAIAPHPAQAQKSVESAGQTSGNSKPAPKNQLAQTRSDLIAATETHKASAQEVVRFQEQEIAKGTKKLEELRQLVADGLIARNELGAAEQELADAKARLEDTHKQIADSENLVAQVKAAEEAEKNLAKMQAAQARHCRRSE
jgi:predicted  nucleic acid-binding Zn-ribbon protein